MKENMHSIWNPWHGCTKKSEGCQHCYMYYLDQIHQNKDPSVVYKTSSFRYPLSKHRNGRYQIQSGEKIHVCLNSDFFLKEADAWREEAWRIMKERSDVLFLLLTKRPERVRECLPPDWKDGYENVSLSVSCENQLRTDERMPILLSLPFKHKGVMCAPLIGEIDFRDYLSDGQIEQVTCGGENYDGKRPCNYDWVKKIAEACKKSNVTFTFVETGTVFIKDGRTYLLKDKNLQKEMAFKSGISFQGKQPVYRFLDRMGLEIPESELYVPHFREHCQRCPNQAICNGCTDCGRCEK